MAKNLFQVLIADDHDYVRMSLALALTTFVNVNTDLIREARSMAQAIALCEEFMPDLMLLDVRLPPTNSIEFITLLQERHCPTKIILLAGPGDEHLVEDAIELGAEACLSRECTLEEIEQAINWVMR